MKEFLEHTYQDLRKRFKDFRQTTVGKRVIRTITHLLQLLIVGIILYQLSDIGWNNFFSSLPTHPLFYGLFLFIYFLLPLAETIAYKIIWGISFTRSFSAFIRKRIFNKDVMGYSGELVLMQWAVSKTSISGKQAFKDIRDMNIISSAASTFIALGILAIFILTGKIRAMDHIFSQSTGDYLIGGFVLLLIIIAAYRFRRYLFAMSFTLAYKVFMIHSVRMVLVFIAQILQWHIVLPEVNLDIWFTFLSVNIIISRIPLIPSHELVATGTNIELAKVLNAPVAGIAGLFLVHNVLDKLLNLSFYTYYSFTGQTAAASLKEERKPADTEMEKSVQE